MAVAAGLAAENPPAADPAGLTISGLTRRRGRVAVLDGLSLFAAPGLLTAIVGPPGSGKSALIRILAGFDRARGAIMFGGRDVARLPPHRRGFGVVQQHDMLFPHLTVAHNVGFPLRLRGTPAAGRARLVAEALDLVHLTALADRMPAELTAAQRQRGTLARAIVFGPPLLLLDEPFSDQDASSRAVMIAGLRRMHALLGTTTLLATGHGTDALAVADRVAVLRAGALEQHGTPEEVFDRPRNAYVAALMGELNRLPGVVEAVDDDIALVRLACGPLVEAMLGKTLEPGDPCVMTLRPDRIAIAPVPAADMGENAIDATLIDAQFLGDAYRLRMLIGSGAELVIRRPAAAGLRGLAVGRVAAVAWQPQHAFAFREGQDAPPA